VASFYTDAVSVLMENPNPKEGNGNYITLIIIIISILVLLIILYFAFFVARKRRKNNEEESIQRVDKQIYYQIKLQSKKKFIIYKFKELLNKKN